jgi:hypothetical protein
MKCPQCEKDNPVAAKFCAHCGGSLALACPACAHENPPGSRFCNECGRSLGDAPATSRSSDPAGPRAYTPPPHRRADPHLRERARGGAQAGERALLRRRGIDGAGRPPRPRGDARAPESVLRAGARRGAPLRGHRQPGSERQGPCPGREASSQFIELRPVGDFDRFDACGETPKSLMHREISSLTVDRGLRPTGWQRFSFFSLNWEIPRSLSRMESRGGVPVRVENQKAHSSGG